VIREAFEEALGDLLQRDFAVHLRQDKTVDLAVRPKGHAIGGFPTPEACEGKGNRVNRRLVK
jgi:hypothetical protein